MENQQIFNTLLQKINNSNFDTKLIQEISLCSLYMNLGNFNKEKKATILTKDLILSAFKMERIPEALLYTDPYSIVEFSWWYKFIKQYNLRDDLSRSFVTAFQKLINSKFFKNSEWSTPALFTILNNIDLLDQKVLNLCQDDLCNIYRNLLFIDKDTLKEVLLYYNQYILKKNLPLLKSLRVYGLFQDDIDLSILISLMLKKNLLPHNINFSLLSISQLLGIYLILEEKYE